MLRRRQAIQAEHGQFIRRQLLAQAYRNLWPMLGMNLVASVGVAFIIGTRQSWIALWVMLVVLLTAIRARGGMVAARVDFATASAPEITLWHRNFSIGVRCRATNALVRHQCGRSPGRSFGLCTKPWSSAAKIRLSSLERVLRHTVLQPAVRVVRSVPRTPKRSSVLRLSCYLLAAVVGFAPLPAAAAEISTHVLDLARGVGGRDVPVVLLRKGENGRWDEVGRGRTDENGRVRSFGEPSRFAPGIYKLQFDMAGYPDAKAAPFFPEIDLVFRVTDPAAHYHVPVVVSPFGYSTYRGN